MRNIIQIVLWIGSAVLAYFIYQSVTGPIQFAEEKQVRYSKVIANLKDIRDAQEAHKTIKGKFANDFKSLVKFVDTEKYIITSKKDSSFMRYNKAFDIDMPVDTVVVRVLDSVFVRDSLFKKDNRYKTMMNVPGVDGKTFEMKADIIDKGGYKAPVFEAKVAKDLILADQPKDLVSKEKAQVSVEEVNGAYVSVGSLTQVSTSGNWPPVYDRKNE